MAALKKGTLRIGLKRRAYKLRDAMTYILRNEKKVAVHVKFKETILIVRYKKGMEIPELPSHYKQKDPNRLVYLTEQLDED